MSTNNGLRYRTKPVEKEAIEWTGDYVAIMNFMKTHNRYIDDNNDLIIETLEGNHKADIGDMIVRGLRGEYYPVKREIFDLTYERVE